MKKKIIATICFCFIGCFLAMNVWAVSWLPLVPCGGSGNPCKLCHLWQLFSNLINFVIFGLSVPIAALLFVVAGVYLLTAGGNESRVGKAREVFTQTLIGLLIIFCSWLIVDTLVKTLVNPSTEAGQVIWAWNAFPSCQ
jgi:hypothetical protein